MESTSIPPVTLKIASLTKNKRLARLPATFSELRTAIEHQIKEERSVFKPDQPNPDQQSRDFTVRYTDGDEELINVSDDEDLQTAYHVAARELNGKLTLKVDFKASPEAMRASFVSGQNLSYRMMDDSISMTQRSSSLVPPLNLGGAAEFVNIPNQTETVVENLVNDAIKKAKTEVKERKAAKKADKEAKKEQARLAKEAKEAKRAKKLLQQEQSKQARAARQEKMKEKLEALTKKFEHTLPQIDQAFKGPVEKLFQIMGISPPQANQEQPPTQANNDEEPRIEEVPYQPNVEERKEEEIPLPQETDVCFDFLQYLLRIIHQSLPETEFLTLQQIVDLMEKDFIQGGDPKVSHHRVQCDGCRAHPIQGPRYKCSVCKNFDFCPRCEEVLEHPHPFIKITDPDLVVDSIVTATVDEENEPVNQEEQAQPECGQQKPPHCGIPEFLSGNKFWKNFNGGNAGCWRDAAESWLTKARGYIPQPPQQPEIKITTISKHEGTIQMRPDEPLVLPFYFKNDSPTAINAGIFFGLLEKREGEILIEDVVLPAIQANTEFALEVPVLVALREALPPQPKLVKLSFSFFDGNRNAFGERIEVSVQIMPVKGDAIIEGAKNLVELGLASFDECLEAVKRFNGSVDEACEYLLSRMY